jgi:hypothetical protein
MKAIYEKTALGLMTVAGFCTIFALTLANADEIQTLASFTIACVVTSFWMLKWSEKK